MLKYLISLAMLAFATVAPAIEVTTQSGLVAALKAGEVEVALVAGPAYKVPYAAKNTAITSSDLTKPALITSVGSGLSNVTITHVVFDAGNVPLAVINSQRVTVADSVVRATNARVKNASTMAVRVSGSSDVTLTRLAISGGDVSVYLTTSTNVSLTDSDITNIGRDGVNVFSVTNLTIARNWFRDWHIIGDEHPDGIQFWTTNAPTGVKKFLIEYNLIECSITMRAQGIFINDEAGIGHSEGVIQGNTVGNGMWHGIGTVGVKGLTIDGNTVLFEINPADVGKPDNQATKRSWIKTDGSAIVTGNTAGQFIGGVQSNNTVKVSSTKAEIDFAVTKWLNKFRAIPLTLEERVARIEKHLNLN